MLSFFLTSLACLVTVLNFLVAATEEATCFIEEGACKVRERETGIGGQKGGGVANMAHSIGKHVLM